MPVLPAVLSVFTYNGISLNIISMSPYERRAIWQGPDYLYTRHTFKLRGIYSPAAASYALSPSPFTASGQGFPPVFRAGQNAPVTDQAIRHALMQPRAPLAYILGQQVVLQVPDPNLAAPDPANPSQFLAPGTAAALFPFLGDANNGPVPLYCNVIQVTGTKTFIVDYGIQTDVNEASFAPNVPFPGRPPILLSNRWDMTESYDEDFYPVRAVKGTAVFRTDRLALLGTDPDNYRGWLIIPLPDSWKRTNLTFSASPDGASVSYSFVDRYTSRTLIGGVLPNVTRVEINESFESANTGLDEVFTNLLNKLTGNILELGQAALAGKAAGAGLKQSKGGGRAGSVARAGASAVRPRSQVSQPINTNTIKPAPVTSPSLPLASDAATMEAAEGVLPLAEAAELLVL
jgi:hypothetical protein